MDQTKKMQSEIQKYIENNISQYVTDTKLKKMLLYSLGEGKRVRPMIIISTYAKLNNTDDIPDYIINAALSIEYFHCASLIFDDIMDGDKVRRGNPAVYVKYGLAMGQMASIMLSSIATRNLYLSLDQLSKIKPDKFNKDLHPILFNLLSGYAIDITFGQYKDIDNSSTDINQLIYQKTTTLFEYCYIIPWLYNNSSRSTRYINKNIVKLKEVARLFGLIFQIADDFEDVKQDAKRNGDNYVIINGYEKAYSDYHNFVKSYYELTDKLNIRTKQIEEVINYLSESVDYYYRNR